MFQYKFRANAMFQYNFFISSIIPRSQCYVSIQVYIIHHIQGLMLCFNTIAYIIHHTQEPMLCFNTSLYYSSYLVLVANAMFQCNCLYNAMFQYNCLYYPSGIERFRGYKRIYRSQMLPFSSLVRHAGKTVGLFFFFPHPTGGKKKNEKKKTTSYLEGRGCCMREGKKGQPGDCRAANISVRTPRRK